MKFLFTDAINPDNIRQLSIDDYIINRGRVNMYSKASGFFNGATREQLEISRKLLSEAVGNPARAIEIARDPKLLSAVAVNPFGISALICGYGDNPEFAKALLSNAHLIQNCDLRFYNVVLETYRKAYIDCEESYSLPNIRASL